MKWYKTNHGGEHCWNKCGKQGGLCPSFCGEGGYCCRLDPEDPEDQPKDCGIAGHKGEHVCVTRPMYYKGLNFRQEHDGHHCWNGNGKKGGKADSYCGKDGACCRITRISNDGLCDGTMGGTDHHVCTLRQPKDRVGALITK